MRTAMDLEQELLSDRRGEEVRVMRSSPQPWLDAHSGERAAGDLVGRLSDLALRGRDGERAHWLSESSGVAPYAQRVRASCAATCAFARRSAMLASRAR